MKNRVVNILKTVMEVTWKANLQTEFSTVMGFRHA